MYRRCIPGAICGTSSRRAVCLAVAGLTIVACLLAACGEYRSLKVDAGVASDVRMSAVWDALAAQGGFDGEEATLESLWLEFSPNGVIHSGRFQAWTQRPELLQVGFNADDRSSRNVWITGGLCFVDPSQAVPGSTSGYTAAAPVFRAIDLVRPSSMIALMESAGDSGFYAFTSAYEMTTPLQPIDPAATAFRWDGTRFVELAPTDQLRQFPGGYEYLVGFAQRLVSSSSTDNLATAQYQGSQTRVYFIIPTPKA
jgi:hypothetical protein